MPKINWEESFSMNDDEIDNQHKKWLSIINTLHDCLMSGDPEEINTSSIKTMKSMIDYAVLHFSYEEEYMERINYPGLAKHRDIHAGFLKMIREQYTDLKSGKKILSTELMLMLNNWLKNHILVEDKKYSLYADSKK